MGTVRYRPDRNAWQIDYIAADGERVRQIIAAGKDGERIARRVLQQREAEAVLSVHRIAPTQTPRFSEFADDWHRRNKARGLRLKTLESYETTERVHLRPVFGERRLGAIGRRDVEAFLASLRETGTRRGKKGARVPLSVTTVNYVLHVFKFILKDAVEQDYLTENPAAPVRPVRDPDSNGHEPVRFLEPVEIRRLFAAAEEPYRTLYEVAVGTGLRRGELLALRWSDLDLAKGLLRVERTRGRVKDGEDYVVREAPLKTKHSRRTIDLSPSLLQTLLAFPSGDDPERDYLFRSSVTGGPLDPDNVDRAFTRHLALAELPRVRVHDLRHTHASLLIAANVHPKAIQARLGHTSITTTLNTYGHLMPSAFQGVGERLDALVYRAQMEVQTQEKTSV